MNPPSPVAPIPVTVLGGYLGAGKTTIVNRVLADAGGERLAVLVNDFGEVNIDAALIESADEKVITLANGCICCSLVDGFAAALDQLRDVPERPDRLLIETSGVALPSTVAAHAQTPGFNLDAVVVAVDAETIRSKAVDAYVGQAVRQQLSEADLLVLTKSDLLDAAELEAVNVWLADTVVGRPIVVSARGLVDPAILLGRFDQDEQEAPGGHSPDGRGSGVDHVSATWRSLTPVDGDRLEQLLSEAPANVVRVKGVVRTDRSPEHQTIVQAVGRRLTLTQGKTWRDGQPSVVVAIAVAEPGRQADASSRLADWLTGRLGGG